MRYALVENDTVINIIWLSASNAMDFPNAFEIGDRPVQIGDTYAESEFYRGGEKIQTELEMLKAQNADMAAALEVLGVSE